MHELKRFILSVMLMLLFLPNTIVYGFVEEDEIETVSSGYPGTVDMFVYVSDDLAKNTTYIKWYNIDSGEIYITYLNPMNFDDANIRAKVISLPNGTYGVSGGLYMDQKGAYQLWTKEPVITINDDTQTVTALIGTYEWIQQNNKAPRPTPTPIPVAEITKTVLPTVIPVKPEAYVPPVEKKDYTSYVLCGGIITILLVLFIANKKK